MADTRQPMETVGRRVRLHARRVQHPRKRQVREPLHTGRGWAKTTVVRRSVDEPAIRGATRPMGQEVPRRSQARRARGRTDPSALEYLILARLRDGQRNSLRARIPEIRERQTRAKSTTRRGDLEAEHADMKTWIKAFLKRLLQFLGLSLPQTINLQYIDRDSQ